MSKTEEGDIFHSTEENVNESNINIVDIKVYKKRWLILICFIIFAISNLIQNMQYAIVADVIKDYYHVPYVAIDWTIILSSLIFLIFSIPASYVLDKLGLRKAVLIGTIGTAIGTWIKLGSVNPNNFWVVLLGQGIVAFFRICFVLILPKVVATWFGYEQIALATGLCYIGFEGGTALSYLFPTLIVVHEEGSNIESRLYINNIIYVALASLTVPIAIFFFTEKPKLPPSYAQKNYITTREANSINFLQECKGIFSNKDYILFMLINAMSVAGVAAIENLSNQIILMYYPDAGLHVGIAGVLHVVCSVTGAVTSSILLDRYKKFRIAAYVVFGLLISSLVLFSTLLRLGLPFVYITFMMIGACFGASLIIHVEIVVELTYPLSQNVTVGISGACAQLATIILTSVYGYIHRDFGNDWANITNIAIVFCADFLFLFVKFNLHRTSEQIEMSNRAKIDDKEFFQINK